MSETEQSKYSELTRLNFDSFLKIPIDLLAVSIVEFHTGQYLMAGHMNKEAYSLTRASGEVVLWSRSRGELSYRGETLSARRVVRDIKYDCDRDNILLSVEAALGNIAKDRPNYPDIVDLNFNAFRELPRDLLTASIIDERTGRYLMTGYMNKEAYSLTRELGEVVFWSRSRQELWHKGETSGNRLIVQEMRYGQSTDNVVISVAALGPVCHRGTVSCFD